MDDYLMPPSAFVQSLNHNISNNENNFYKLGIENISVFPSSSKNNFENSINASTQTNYTKLCNKACLTSESVITVEDMKSKLFKKKEKYLLKINTLKEQHDISQSETKEIIDDLKKHLSYSNKEKLNYQEELERMKFYISGVENREVWIKERHKLLEQIEQFDLNRREQDSIIDSLKIQLSNMEKIQSIQEREIEKEIVKSNFYQLSSKEIRYETLLRAWRHKVLSLLVQQESNDVCVGNERHKLNNEIQNRQNEIEHLHSVINGMNLKLESNDAQISENNMTIQKLRRENAYIRNEIKVINEDRFSNERDLNIICIQLQTFQNQMEVDFERKLHTASTKLDVFQRRLEYASSRFPMIESSIIRSKNLTMQSNSDKKYNIDFGSLEFRYNELKEALLITNKEIEQLRLERDQLICTVEQDSATFHDRINQKKEELDEEMNKLQHTVTNLETSSNKNLRELEAVKNENTRLKKSYDELLNEKFNETENLQAALNKSKTDMSTLSLEFSEFKRSSINERNKMEEQLRWFEQKLAERESFWMKNCDQLNAECNLLKMTIRQNGLLSKLNNKNKSDSRCLKSNINRIENSEKNDMLKEIENLTHEFQTELGDC